jgi:hypothetical protein
MAHARDHDAPTTAVKLCLHVICVNLLLLQFEMTTAVEVRNECRRVDFGTSGIQCFTKETEDTELIICRTQSRFDRWPFAVQNLIQFD